MMLTLDAQPRHAVLVEDDRAVLRGFGIMLQTFGFLVRPVQSVAEAREDAKAIPETPTLLVVDHRLPDGTEKDIAAIWPGVPMLVVSGYERTPEYVGEWLRKPVTWQLMAQGIERTLPGVELEGRKWWDY